MTGTWIAITVTGVVLIGATFVGVVRRQRVARLTPLERARLATRELRGEDRARRGRGRRGDGDHFGRTKIKKYGDEHHGGDEPSAGWGGGGDHGGGGDSGGSSW